MGQASAAGVLNLSSAIGNVVVTAGSAAWFFLQFLMLEMVLLDCAAISLVDTASKDFFFTDAFADQPPAQNEPG
jgi:hypothetical protein